VLNHEDLDSRFLPNQFQGKPIKDLVEGTAG
jgi:hypothetical protein